MPDIIAWCASVRAALETIHPLAPWLLLAALCSVADLVAKRLGWSAWVETRVPWGKLAVATLAGLPVTVLGAAWPAVTSGDTDPASAVKGALFRALVPVVLLVWAWLPKPPKGGTGTALLVLMLGAPAVSGCAFWQEAKPVVRTVDDLARDACALFFSKQMGIDPVAAAQAYCATREEWAPFIDPILAAQREGGTLALKARQSDTGD